MIAQRSTKDETMTVSLGILLPGQIATLKSTIISLLEVVGGHYQYSLPAAFFPNYKKHGIKDISTYPYDFFYEVTISAKHTISNLSVPSSAMIVEQSDD